MTRREFIQEIFKTSLAVITGIWFWAKKVAPRRFTRALKHNKYPGSVKSLQKIDGPGKWSG